MRKYVIVMLFAFVVFFQGCASKEDEKINSDTSDKITEGIATETPKEEGSDTENTTEDNKTEDTTQDATEDKSAESEVTVDTSNLVLPVTTNASGKVMIQTVSESISYPFTSYIITSVNGESIVVDPSQMPETSLVEINPAAILCTHSHPDHTDSKFTDPYEVPKLMFEEGEINTKDFHIYSILSAHRGDEIGTSNVIMVIEVDGLRIAHMGDIGQTALTEDQLKALGEIDIAFMQFENSYSGMNLKNELGFTLIEQLNPKIIIPTHYTEAGEPVLVEKYGDITEFENILEISKEDLPTTKLTVYKILNLHKYR